MSVKAIRDIGSGLFLLIVLLGSGTQLHGWMMLAGWLIALLTKLSGGPAKAYDRRWRRAAVLNADTDAPSRGLVRRGEHSNAPVACTPVTSKLVNINRPGIWTPPKSQKLEAVLFPNFG
ncbi:hypothetical protein [Streptomyces sp. NPDC058653]|uniref:hypothetical protein n=1 Tax=Streptomyces sp. NPDC058653 TaxID=3346576 RepID=UPI00366420BF